MIMTQHLPKSFQASVSFLFDATGRPFTKPIYVATQFLSVIAPGGYISDKTRSELRGEFLAVNNGQYSEQLNRIEGLIQSWAASATLDLTQTVREIMLTIQPENNHTWIGFSNDDRPPNDGFFADRVFEVRAPGRAERRG